MIAARGVRGIHEWRSLIGHEGKAQVVYQNEATSRPQGTLSSNWLVL